MGYPNSHRLDVESLHACRFLAGLVQKIGIESTGIRLDALPVFGLKELLWVRLHLGAHFLDKGPLPLSKMLGTVAWHRSISLATQQKKQCDFKTTKRQ
jgi:hypothetical protein